MSIYHVYNRSIADFVIFNNDKDYRRMVDAVGYYRTRKPNLGFAHYNKLMNRSRIKDVRDSLDTCLKKKHIEIVAYCLMPTHFHLVLKEIGNKGIQIYIGNLLNSYTRYFNLSHNRKGPLWEGHYKKVLVESDEQLIHLTRYIHLNPITAYLVNKPEDWPYSSYNEYISSVNSTDSICDYRDLVTIAPDTYKIFVEQHIEYQQDLAKAKATESDLGGRPWRSDRLGIL